jgi:hypothetical protein
MKIHLIVVAFSIFLYNSCQKKSGLARAKTTQEALESISNIDYQLVRLTLNKKEIPMSQAVSLKFINKGIKENTNEMADALNGFTGKRGVVSIITNIKGFENSDEQKPFYYNIEYFNEQSQKHLKFQDFGLNITDGGTSLTLGFEDANLNRRVYYFKKQQPQWQI